MPNISELINNILNSPILDHPIVQYILIILPAVFGIVYCLYGYKLTRVISTLVGACIGTAVGYMIAKAVNPDFPINIVIMVAGAVIFGLVGYFLYKLGVFLMVFPVVFAAAAALVSKYTTLDQLVVAIIALVAGLIFGILSVIYDRPLIIIASAIGGAMLFANQLFGNLVRIRWDAQMEMMICLGTGAVLALIGLIYQFRSTKGLKVRRSRRDDYDED